MGASEPGSTPAGWDEAADTYAEVGDSFTAGYALDTVAALAVGPGDRVLDLAAGTGAAALAAARRGAEVVAMDWSPEMIRTLAGRAAAEGLGRVAAVVGDGQKLDLPAGSFDVACSVFGVFLFADFRAGLGEMARVLRPGGRAGVTVWAGPDRLEHLSLWDRAVRTAYPAFAGLGRPAGWERMGTPDGLGREMSAAGFRAVEVRPLAHRVEVRSARTLVGSVDRNPVMAAAYDRLGPDARGRVREAFLSLLRDRFGDGPVQLSSVAHVGIGTK